MLIKSLNKSIVLILSFLFIGCTTTYKSLIKNGKLDKSMLDEEVINNCKDIQKKGNDILVLIDKSSFQDYSFNSSNTSYDSNNNQISVPLLKKELNKICSSVTFREFDGIIKEDFISLLKYTTNGQGFKQRKTVPDLLKIIYNEKYDKIYTLEYSGNTVHSNIRYPDEEKFPNSSCYEFKRHVSGFIVTPFTLNVNNNYYMFSNRELKGIINEIIKHSALKCYDYEYLYDSNLKNEIMSIAEDYFTKDHYTNDSYERDLLDLFTISELYVDFDGQINQYLIDSFSKNPGIDNKSGLKLIRKCFFKSVSDPNKFKTFIDWLNSKIDEPIDYLEVALSEANNSINTYQAVLNSSIQRRKEDYIQQAAMSATYAKNILQLYLESRTSISDKKEIHELVKIMKRLENKTPKKLENINYNNFKEEVAPILTYLGIIEQKVKSFSE